MQSLDSLIQAASPATDLRFVFVGGKGGVGKTTCSSSLATLLARLQPKRNILLVSTDPAHSLSDAFRCDFQSEPRSPNEEELPNLHVMEVDPSQTLEKELESWSELVSESGGGAFGFGNVASLREWIASIPGIDEATALSQVLQKVESGTYDLIIVDTAPTGHTLKLLGMPEVLTAGIRKLESWQGAIWGMWEGLKGMGRSNDKNGKKVGDPRKEVARRLEKYRNGIEKVGAMLQDKAQTRFVAVCIAEHLSISETKRLLRELQEKNVRASHVIVNQLVLNDALSDVELNNLEAMAEVGGLDLDKDLLRKTVHACRLSTARRSIQQRYLDELKSCQESSALEGICELPLLPEEVTGHEALNRFGCLMITKDSTISTVARDEKQVEHTKVQEQGSSQKDQDTSGETPKSIASYLPRVGDSVSIVGLVKSPHFNGLKGEVVAEVDTNTGRCGIEVQYRGKKKKLALKPETLSPNSYNVGRTKRKGNSPAKQNDHKRSSNGTAPAEEGAVNEENVSKAKALLDDPEIKSMIDANPRFKDAAEDVISNPMNVMKYLGDPEMSPLISKAMEKLRAK